MVVFRLKFNSNKGSTRIFWVVKKNIFLLFSAFCKESVFFFLQKFCLIYIFFYKQQHIIFTQLEIISCQSNRWIDYWPLIYLLILFQTGKLEKKEEVYEQVGRVEKMRRGSKMEILRPWLFGRFLRRFLYFCPAKAFEKEERSEVSGGHPRADSRLTGGSSVSFGHRPRSRFRLTITNTDGHKYSPINAIHQCQYGTCVIRHVINDGEKTTRGNRRILISSMSNLLSSRRQTHLLNYFIFRSY